MFREMFSLEGSRLLLCEFGNPSLRTKKKFITFCFLHYFKVDEVLAVLLELSRRHLVPVHKKLV